MCEGMMSLKNLLLVSLAVALPSVSAGRASTLSPLPASCFSYSFGSSHPSAHGLTGTKLHATLPGTEVSLDVQSVSLNDNKSKIDADTLERFNAAAAFAALTAFHGGLTPACHGQSTIVGTSDIQGSSPEGTWSSVRLQKADGHDLTIRSAHIETVETDPDLRVRLVGTGIHASKQPLAPSTFTTDLTVQGAGSAAQQISINSLHAVVDTSTIDGHGIIQPGTSAATSTADVHISITDIAGLIQNVQQTAPAKVTTALTIARLMGHNNGNSTTWDVQLQGGVVTVNRVPLPIPVH